MLPPGANSTLVPIPDRGSFEHRFRVLVESALDAISILTIDGVVLEMNQRAIDMVGRPRDSQIGHRITEWRPGDKSEILEAFRRTAREGATNADVRIDRPDGTSVYVDFNNQLVQLDGQQVVLSTGRDVTARYRAMAELQLLHSVALEANQADDLNSALQLLLEQISTATGWEGGVAWLPNTARTILEPRTVWAASEEIVAQWRGVLPPSLSPGEGLAGLAWQSAKTLWSEDVLADPRTVMAAAISMRSAITIPAVLGGQVVAVLQCFASHPRAEDAHALMLAGAIATHAVTVVRRKRADEALRHSEDQLRQSQKMEAIGQLTGGIAHDFNNLLGVILGNTEMLLEKIPPGDSRRGDAEEIVKAGQRAAALTRQLLAFGRKQMLQPRVVVLAEVVSGVETMLRRLIGEQIRFTTTLAPDAGKVFADAGQIEQVLLNLAVNARDAMPDGGELRIEVRNTVLDDAYVIDHGPAKPGRYVMITVSDSGCGMEPETRRRAFEPFFTTKEKGRGTGLGLSTCYGIVKQSEGYIWLYSEPGRGTTFKIYLPQVDLPEQAVAAPVAAVAAGGGETILVVEDEESLRRVVEKTLRRSGYAVLLARDAAEGLAICNSAAGGCIDLILSDVITPVMTGPEMCRRLRAAGNRTPVLFMSGYVHMELPSGSDGQGNFLQKPFTADALVRKVRELLEAPPEGT